MFQFSNRVRTILARNITVGDTTLIAASGTGAEFPSPTAPGDAIALTLVSASNSRHYEIVYCVQRNGDTFTVWRGQEGTTPLPFQSGDLISLNMTAALYRRMAQAGYLGQFSPEVAQSPSAYRKGAIVCDGTDAAVYWISLQDQNSTAPGAGNPTWMKLDLPSFQKAIQNGGGGGGYGGLIPTTVLGSTLDDVDDGFFDREQARLLAALETQQRHAQLTQQAARAEQKITLALKKIGVTP
ncbi:hypothetical protein AL01_01200 [Bombella intestini]|uniref:Uncharacterized protein n=1 Tax=Bombella intestini TaxID=1539051 RepID=A0A1S8GRD9_9PROT|nr:hypothetical protein [Bombella intestini]OOL19627.1 hypothetical protein AL01_01200 [Bombella intestini]